VPQSEQVGGAGGGGRGDLASNVREVLAAKGGSGWTASQATHSTPNHWKPYLENAHVASNASSWRFSWYRMPQFSEQVRVGTVGEGEEEVARRWRQGEQRGRDAGGREEGTGEIERLPIVPWSIVVGCCEMMCCGTMGGGLVWWTVLIGMGVHRCALPVWLWPGEGGGGGAYSITRVVKATAAVDEGKVRRS